MTYTKRSNSKGNNKKKVVVPKRRSISRSNNKGKGNRKRQTKNNDEDTSNNPIESKKGVGKYDIKWNQRIKELKEYRKKHGNCLVPTNYQHNKSLGKWVKKQRYQYRLKLEGKYSTMTDERINELEAIDFVWNARFDGLTANELWDQRLEELKEYRKKHGNCNVPKGYSSNKQLGLWVYTQRKEYRFKQKRMKAKITDKRIKELEAIGFVWEVKKKADDELWNQRLDELKEYCKKHGNCNVPNKYQHNKQLRIWVETQRTQYRLKQEGKKSTITDERIAQLIAIGFVWKLPRGGKRVKNTNSSVEMQKNDSNKRTSNTSSNKKRKRQQSQNPPPLSPPTTKMESEKIKRRRIMKERLKIWRDKPGTSIRDLL